MRTYDILVESLHPEYYKRRAGANNVITKWERGVKADTLSEAYDAFDKPSIINGVRKERV